MWAALSAGMAALAATVLGRDDPLAGGLAAAPWLVTALLLAIDQQPAYLALAAVQWALSLVALLPGARPPFGPDPLGLLLADSSVETIMLALVRVFLAAMLWNQFLFYRMLYGTASATGLDASLPPIPEVVRNRTDSLALWSRLLGPIGLLVCLASVALRTSGLGQLGLDVALAMATLAIGLALGAAFSPTTRRAAALTGLGLGGLAFLSILVASRLLSH